MFPGVDFENQWALRREIFHSWYPAGGSPTTKRPLPLPGFVKTHLINSVCLRVALGRLLEIATPGTPINVVYLDKKKLTKSRHFIRVNLNRNILHFCRYG